MSETIAQMNDRDHGREIRRDILLYVNPALWCEMENACEPNATNRNKTPVRVFDIEGRLYIPIGWCSWSLADYPSGRNTVTCHRVVPAAEWGDNWTDPEAWEVRGIMNHIGCRILGADLKWYVVTDNHSYEVEVKTGENPT